MPGPRSDDTVNLHGTAIAVAGWAALIRGPSGAGKSDLALRCLAMAPGPLAADQPMLVADDRVVARRLGDAIRISCPAVLLGLIEVRGVGVVSVPHSAEAELALVADLVAPSEVERMPEPLEPAQICGLPVPRASLTPFEASAPLKLLLALAAAVEARNTAA